MTWDDTVREFWDVSHKRGSTLRLGRTSAAEHADYFGRVGPFAEDLHAAKAVLDVGPGFGFFLASLEGKKAYAIDVSSVSRDRVRAMGVQAFGPGEIGSSLVELATCLSVVQHCDEPAVGLILDDVARALVTGGSFYVNGVCGGHCRPTKEGLLGGGRFRNEADRVIELAKSRRMSVSGDHRYRLGAVGVWILRFTKL